jgi:CRISPR/Cas system-associated protein Cas5 (RAMP superfamily)
MREPKAKSDIVLDANLLRRPKKKNKFKIEKEIARRMRTQKINNKIRTLTKKTVFCSTLSEFENFLLCGRILINVTTNERSS